MGMLSALLGLCERNPLVLGRFPAQRASSTKLWCFLCWKLKQATDQLVKLLGDFRWHDTHVISQEWTSSGLTTEINYNSHHLAVLVWGMFRENLGQCHASWCPSPWCCQVIHYLNYRKISNIRCTKSPNLHVPRLVLQFYLPKLLMPGIKSRMKM